jgi:hypothetical protein
MTVILENPGQYSLQLMNIRENRNILTWVPQQIFSTINYQGKLIELGLQNI